MKNIDKLVESFVVEGVDDEKYRKIAEASHASVLEHLKQLGSSILDQPKTLRVETTMYHGMRALVGTLSLSRLDHRDEHEEVYFRVFSTESKPNTGARFMRYPSGPMTIDFLFQQEQTKDDNEKRKQVFKQYLSTRLSAFLKKYKTAYVHEFIHMLDARRHKGKSLTGGKRASGNADKDYFNDPLETNAYVQETFSAINDELKDAKTSSDAKKIMGNTPQEFFRKVSSAMHPSAFGNMTVDNKKKLAKRSYQMWQDVLKRFS